MAKVYFGKLNLNIDKTNKTISLPDGTEIEVKQYLPIEDKMTIIDNVINRAVTDKGYYSSVIIDILLTIEIIFAYTNINITEKQREDIYKIYDMFISTGAFKTIKEAIPSAELDFIYSNTYKFIEILYTYKNSALGIMDAINADYGDTVYEAEQIQNALGDKDNLRLVKDILEKLD